MITQDNGVADGNTSSIPNAARTKTSNHDGSRAVGSHRPALKQIDREAAEIALDVDVMILDYQAYMTTRILLDHASQHGTADDEAVRTSIRATDAFLTSFKQRHPHCQPDKALRLRLLLLQFTTVYVRRCVHDESSLDAVELKALRADCNARAKRWIQSFERIPTYGYDETTLEALQAMPSFPAELLTYTRAHVLQAVGAIAEDHLHHYGTDASVSLLDLLPMFMTVCAVVLQEYSALNVTAVLHLITEFMLQACLERYLVYGAGETLDPIDEAFAWGCFAAGEEDLSNGNNGNSLEQDTNDGTEHDIVQSIQDRASTEMHAASTGAISSLMHDSTLSSQAFQIKPRLDLTDSERAIDAMFRDHATGEESTLWTDAKKFVLDELLSDFDTTDSAAHHIQAVAQEHPVQEFQNSMGSFLSQCMLLIELPTLTQIEQGKLLKLTHAQSREFFRSCGLSQSGTLR